jgi:Tol biopolymer transport system component
MGPAGTTLTAPSLDSSISADGRFVAFNSTGNITGTDSNGASPDVFVRDTALGKSYLVSTALFLAQGGTGENFGRISGDGRYIAYTSTATMGLTDTNNLDDVFVRALRIPEITTITPTTVGRGAPVTLTLTGSNFLSGARAMVAGTYASAVTVNNEHSITLTVTLPSNTTLGAADVFVNNLGTGPGPDSGTVGSCNRCVTVV